VTSIDPDDGTVRVGPRAALRRTRCVVGAPQWLAEPRPGQLLLAQLRHHHVPERVRLGRTGEDGSIELRFEQPSEAVTPGQYAVLYDGDRVLGGGRILREPERATLSPAQPAR
jgi:tRNA-specific 2-thiouridylase